MNDLLKAGVLQVQIDAGSFQAAVTKQLLDDENIGTAF